MTKACQNAASVSRIQWTADNDENASALIGEAKNTAVARFLHGTNEARVQEYSEEDQSDTAVLLWASMGNGSYEQPLPGNTQ